jgi:hypothetical protein
MKNNIISISGGNKKMGEIPSVSLPPIITCAVGVPCAEDCYVIKNIKYSTATLAYSRNLEIYYEKPRRFFKQIIGYCLMNEPKYFRYFVGGDIPDQKFLDLIIETADRLKDVNFMFMTKSYMDRYYMEWKHNNSGGSPENRGIDILCKTPENLSIIASTWPKYPIPQDIKDGLPIAYMDDGTEDRITPEDYVCNKLCEECLHCWNAKNTRINVVFKKH